MAFGLNKKKQPTLNPAEEAERAARGLTVDEYNKQKAEKAKKAERETSMKKTQDTLDSYQNFGDKQAEKNELEQTGTSAATGNDQAAINERINTLQNQQNNIVSNLTEEQKADLQGDIDNKNIPGASDVTASQMETESSELNKPQPEQTEQTKQETIAEKSQDPEIQQQAVTTAAQRFAERMGISEQEAQGYLDAFVKGKMPPGSKGYFIGNAIVTAAQNIANQLAASEYNNRWSSIRSGAHIDPEMQKSAWQEYKADNLNKLQDIQAQMAKENLTGEGKNQVEQGKLQNQILSSEAIMKNIDALGYQEKQDLEMEMKRAGLDQQKLSNELLKFSKMNEEEKSKYYAELASMDAATARATLNSLKYGGANLSVKVPGVAGSIDLATVANMGGDLKALLKKAGIE